MNLGMQIDEWLPTHLPSWFPTHEIRIGYSRTFVMERDGILYTKAEWESGVAGGAWRIFDDGFVTFQGREPQFDFSVRCLGRVFG